MQMLKKALISYVNSAKAIWSAIAHPLTIIGSKKCNVKDYKIYGGGKNLLDVQKYYGKYANDNGGISIPKSAILYELSYNCEKITGVFKENTQYTFSCKYNIAETTTTVLTQQIRYTDGTRSNLYLGYGYRMGEGVASHTSTKGKTVASFSFTYGTTSKVFEGELTEMQIEEGDTATEYEPYVYTDSFPITVRGKNILDMSKLAITEGYYLDSTGKISSNSLNGRLLKLSVINVEPNTTYTISSNVAFYTIWYFDGSTAISVERGNKRNKISFITPENCESLRISFDLSITGQTGEGISAVEWIMLEKGEGNGIFEPYIEPQTIDISLDEPIGAGEVIQKSKDGLPNLPQFKGTTIYEVLTDTPPSGIEVCYYG